MKKVLVAVLLAVTLLTGCSVHIDSKSNESPSPTVASTSPTQAYIDEIRSGNVAAAEGVPDADLVELGRNSCGALDSGATFDEIAQAYMQNDFDPYDAGVITGAAVRNLCPQHERAMNEWAANNG